jgi:hypothetical protein
MIVARQFIVWNAQKNARSRRDRHDQVDRAFLDPVAVNTSGSAAHTVTYGTVTFFGHIPGNKLTGYAHLVPSGQRLSTLVHEFGASSRDRFEHEHEPEHERDKDAAYPTALELLIASTRS